MTRDSRKQDQQARAAWMYYVAGQTQDDIARALGVSRQTAQRLVAQAMASGMVKVRIDHPLARCRDLGDRLRAAFGLTLAEVAPDQAGPAGVAMALADLIEAELARPDPQIVAIGTGRTLRAAVGQMSRIDCPQHRIVSLTGNIAPDGSAAYYNVLFSLSDLVTARIFPLMVPVIAATAEEKDALHRQPGIARVMELAGRAQVAFVGLGSVDPDAPLLQDGFLTGPEVAALHDAGAVGEILGRAYDAQGRLLPDQARVAAAPLPDTSRTRVIAAVHGTSKRTAALGALRGGLVTGLVIDEASAEWLLAQGDEA